MRFTRPSGIKRSKIMATARTRIRKTSRMNGFTKIVRNRSSISHP